jgi:four helix bundle protein
MTEDHNRLKTHRENNHGFTFRDWDIYKDGRAFRKKVNQIVETYPQEEKYALGSQTKRALNSIILNTAEGANKSTDKDTRLYINRAHCSLDEVVACLDCALDSGYISEDQHQELMGDAESLAKRLRQFTKHLSRTSSIK